MEISRTARFISGSDFIAVIVVLDSPRCEAGWLRNRWCAESRPFVSVLYAQNFS
jgi:hypothetical protein